MAYSDDARAVWPNHSSLVLVVKFMLHLRNGGWENGRIGECESGMKGEWALSNTLVES